MVEATFEATPPALTIKLSALASFKVLRIPSTPSNAKAVDITTFGLLAAPLNASRIDCMPADPRRLDLFFSALSWFTNSSTCLRAAAAFASSRPIE
jgi:hypothetical protein